jgi:hypothetical protein
LKAEFNDKYRRTTLIAGWGLMVLLIMWESFILTFDLVATIHESGHALACTAQGYKVLLFCPLCRPQPITRCTNNHTALIAVGGTLMSLSAWILVTASFAPWLLRKPHHHSVALFIVFFTWSIWSILCSGEVLKWATLAYSTRIPMPDTVNFSTTTGINPHRIIVGALILFALMTAAALPLTWKIVCTFWAMRTEILDRLHHPGTTPKAEADVTP